MVRPPRRRAGLRDDPRSQQEVAGDRGASPAVTMLAELPFSGLADRVGRKPVFLIATVASLMASVVFILSAMFWPRAA